MDSIGAQATPRDRLVLPGARPIHDVLSTRLLRLRPALVILALISTAVVVLLGRYNWTAAGREGATIGYVSSAYLLVITLPTLYYVVNLFVGNRLVARASTAVAAIALTLPYHWLGLDRWYYNANHPVAYDAPDASTIHTAWLPQATLGPASMPREVAFFALLLAVGFALAASYWRLRSRRGDASPVLVESGAVWFGIFLLLVIETWLHLSMRSPYVYLTHYEQSAPANYWYAQYLFPNGMGAVNADYVGLFRPIDDLFLGFGPPSNTTMINRSYPHYLSTQLSYFVSPYYVYLLLNITVWLLACLSTYRLAARLWNREAGLYAAFLVATGSGFIMFVAEPMSYLAGYAIVVMLFVLVEEALVRRAPSNKLGYVAIGAALGLASLVYEIFPIYPCLAMYVAIRRASLKELKGLALSLVLGLAVYYGFLELEGGVLGVNLESMHSAYHEASWKSVIHLLSNPRFGELYTTSVLAMRTYFGSLINAFFVVPVLLALVGALVLRDRSKGMALLALGIPSALGVIFLQFGGVQWGNPGNPGVYYIAALPRFAYVTYPAVYLLAAVALVELRSFLLDLSCRSLARCLAAAAPWAILGLIFVLNNVDVLGNPQMYFLFYYPDGGSW